MYAEATEPKSTRPSGSGDPARSKKGTLKLWICRNDHGTQPQLKRLSNSASECLKIDLYFRISQEH